MKKFLNSLALVWGNSAISWTLDNKYAWRARFYGISSSKFAFGLQLVEEKVPAAVAFTSSRVPVPHQRFDA